MHSSDVWQEYIFDRPYPERLNFRDAAVALEVVTRPGTEPDWWYLQARKLPDGQPVDLVITNHGRGYMEVELYRNGFSHVVGTPAARILDCLVRLGYAHVLPPRGGPQGLAHTLASSRA